MYRLLGVLSALTMGILAVFYPVKGAQLTASDWEEYYLQDTETAGLVTFDPEKAVWQDGYGIDMSNAKHGIVTVSCTSEDKLHLWVRHEMYDTDYAIPNDGTPFTIPLSCGDGEYKISVMECVRDTKYKYGYTVSLNAHILDSKLPYLYTNGYVSYNSDSICVKKAEEIAKQSKTREEFIENVKTYIESNITYDKSYVPTKLSAHNINPDSTIRDRSGICFDFASLMTAMLRSQGIPARLVFGYLSSDSDAYYHAWTDVYIDGEWVTVDACLSEEEAALAAYRPTQYF